MLFVNTTNADVYRISMAILIVFVMLNAAIILNVLLISSVNEMSALIHVKECADRTLYALYSTIDQYVTVIVVILVILTLSVL